MSDFQDVKSTHTGRIFLIGNGPSLNEVTDEQWKKLHDEYTFTGSRWFDWDRAFSPSFFILTERKQNSDWLSHGYHNKVSAGIKFWVAWQPAPKGWVSLPQPPSNAHDVLNYGLLGGLTGKCTEGVEKHHMHHGKDTPLAMMQVASYMGFSEMYLLGCETTTVGEIYDANRQRTSHVAGIMPPYYAKAASVINLTDCTPGGTLNTSGTLKYKPLKEVLS